MQTEVYMNLVICENELRSNYFDWKYLINQPIEYMVLCWGKH